MINLRNIEHESSVNIFFNINGREYDGNLFINENQVSLVGYDHIRDRHEVFINLNNGGTIVVTVTSCYDDPDDTDRGYLTNYIENLLIQLGTNN